MFSQCGGKEHTFCLVNVQSVLISFAPFTEQTEFTIDVPSLFHQIVTIDAAEKSIICIHLYTQYIQKLEKVVHVHAEQHRTQHGSLQDPYSTFLKEEIKPLNITSCLLSLRQSVNKLKILSLKTSLNRLFTKMWQFKKLKAFSRSTKMHTTKLPSLNCLLIQSVRSMIRLCVPKIFLKPDYSTQGGLLDSKQVYSLLCRMFSNILPGQGSREIGLILSTIVFFFPFSIRVTIASFYLCGKTPLSIH